MTPRIIRIGRAFGDSLDAMLPLVALVFAWMAARAAVWIIGGLAQ